MEWGSTFRGWCQTTGDAREDPGEKQHDGGGGGQHERCLMISALPISSPGSGQTNGAVDLAGISEPSFVSLPSALEEPSGFIRCLVVSLSRFQNPREQFLVTISPTL